MNRKFYTIYLFVSNSKHKMFNNKKENMINGQSGGVLENLVGPLRAWALKQNLKSNRNLHPLDAPGKGP